jgi:1-deoxy-D-xylulose-5-phosphate reductoisomerase
MNKGLEVIEAHHLFGMDYEKIEVVVHPQSIVHSAIEYVDGSVVAQIGLPSMHIPIQYAICYPERFSGIKSKSFSFSEIARLDFEPPNLDKFKSLKIAYDCGKKGGSFPICMNAANEEAVFEFLNGNIKLFDIIETVEVMLRNHTFVKTPTLDDIFEIDKETRIKTKEYLNKIRY